MKTARRKIKNKKQQSLFRVLLELFFLAPLVLFGFVFLSSSHVQAASGINRTINFQGRVINKTSGTNVTDGNYTFVFKIYDSSSAGTKLWGDETQSSVAVTNGIFQVALGSVRSFATDSLDFNQDNLWLDITFNGENFGSRVRLAAVPYAVTAEKVSGLTVTQTTGTLTIANGKTLTANSTATIGGTDGKTLTLSDNTTLGTNAITLAGGEVITFTASNAVTFTTTGTTTITLPTSGTLAVLGANTFTAAQTIQSNSSTALTAGANGSTNPVLQVDDSATSVATGLKIAGAATGGTTAITVIDSGSNAGLSINAKGSGALSLNTSNTGNVSIGNGTGTVTLTLGSDATGDLFYRSSGGGLTRLADIATGSCLTSGGVATAPAWGSCAAGGGIGTIQEGGSNVVTSASTLNFTANDFNITNSGGGTGLVAIDYTNSGITRTGQVQTITGGWTFNTVQTTFTSLIHANGGIDTSTANQNLTLGANGLGNITATVNGGGAAGLVLNDTGAGPIFTASASGTTIATLANTGSLTINNTTSTDIVKSTSGNNLTPTDYQYTANATSSTLTNLNNTSGVLSLGNGTVPNSGTGTIGNGATVNLAIGAGALTISRTDGKYLVIRGGVSSGTAIYDSFANTFTASTALSAATLGAGALALPRPDGKYELIFGNATATRNTIDPLMNTGPAAEAGSNFCASATSGTVAYRRLNGKFLVTCGGLATTALFDPAAVSWTASMPSATTGTWGAGALALPRPDGQALIIEGGASANTQLYDPYNGTTSQGSFTAGPSLPSGCEINGAGSVAIQLPNYTYLILSKANVNTIYDPSAGTFGACNGTGPSTALADGAHAIPLQNGKYLIIVGSGSTKAIIYDPTAGTFTDHGTALNTVGAGAHSFMRPDGTWEILDGGGTSTNEFNTGLPMTGQYVSEDITSSNLNITSTISYSTGAQNTVTGQIGQPTNGQSGVQIEARTASSQGNLATATDKYIQNSGNLIYPTSGDTWIRLTVNFTRRIPQDIMDDRGTWTGNGKTAFMRDYQSPLLKEITIDNATLLRNTSFDFTNPQPSSSNSPGPTLTRMQGMVDKLVLPPGVLTETAQVGTTGFYAGKPGAHNPLPVLTGDGTIVLQRPDKLFGIIATASANFTLYDSTTATFSAQAGAGNIPTANTGGGAFALKLPGEKYLIVMAGGTTTTNIYDPYAASGSQFTTGPTLSAAAGMGATAILNADNTYTIVHGGGATSTSIFDPVGNQGAGTLPAGPTLTTAANCGFFAIPMAAPNSYQYFVAPGVAQGVIGSRVGINYDAKAKVFTQDSATFFTAAQAPGCGAHTFQRQDGYWLIVNGMGLTAGGTSGATNLYNPWSNTSITG
ncbi:MAG: beta strand repeat-containing protein, partial [Candidatus Levyibacteriota bacterium]